MSEGRDADEEAALLAEDGGVVPETWETIHSLPPFRHRANASYVPSGRAAPFSSAYSFRFAWAV